MTDPDKPRSRGRPRTQDVARLDRHILDTATTEFQRHGYGGASMARIVRAAGVSPKTLYARYADKHALLLAVVDRLVAPSSDRLTALSAAAGHPFRDRLAAVVTELAQHWTSPVELELYRLIIGEGGRFPELSAIYLSGIARMVATLEALLGLPDARDALAIADVRDAARELGLLTAVAVRNEALLHGTLDHDGVVRIVNRGLATFLSAYGTPLNHGR